MVMSQREMLIDNDLYVHNTAETRIPCLYVAQVVAELNGLVSGENLVHCLGCSHILRREMIGRDSEQYAKALLGDNLVLFPAFRVHHSGVWATKTMGVTAR